MSVETECVAVLGAVDQRCCELQVELGEWKEATDAERQRVNELENRLAEAHQQQRLLVRTVEHQKAEMDRSAHWWTAAAATRAAPMALHSSLTPLLACCADCSLNEEVEELQRRLFQASMDSDDSHAKEGSTAPKPVPTLDWATASLPPATTLQRLPLFPSSAPSFTAGSATPSILSSSCMYEELVDLHEAVSSLEQQLLHAQRTAALEAQRAHDANQRLHPLQRQLALLTAEVDGLRLSCGDQESRRRVREGWEREVREDLRRWRLAQEEEFGRRMNEREARWERERREEEERSALQSRQLAASVKECGQLAEELSTMWTAHAPTARVAAALRPGAEDGPAGKAVQCASRLKLLRSSILDEKARTAVSDTPCRLQ